MRRYTDDSELGPLTHAGSKSLEYGAPMLVIHRGDLQRVLLQAALGQNVDLRTRSKVARVEDDFRPSVQLASGEWISGDLVLGADGIHSLLRKKLASHFRVSDKIIPTGDSAYRVSIPRSALQEEPEILSHLDQGISTRWLGDGGHIMAYPIRHSTQYNMVFVHLSHPNRSDETNLWSQRGSKEEMRAFYKDWSPTVQRLISYVPASELMEWPLNIHSPLPSWTLGRTALLGDACHPMLPYVAQGAAQAIEDAGTLAVCLSMSADVPLTLKVYETVRKNRAETIQSSATATQRALHLPDGPEQEERDSWMKGLNKKTKGGTKDMWADKNFQNFMWGVDVMNETRARWETLKWEALREMET